MTWIWHRYRTRKGGISGLGLHPEGAQEEEVLKAQEGSQSQVIRDAMTGQELAPGLVRVARRLEM